MAYQIGQCSYRSIKKESVKEMAHKGIITITLVKDFHFSSKKLKLSSYLYIIIAESFILDSETVFLVAYTHIYATYIEVTHKYLLHNCDKF